MLCMCPFCMFSESWHSSELLVILTAQEAAFSVLPDLLDQPQPPNHTKLLLHGAPHGLALTPLDKLYNWSEESTSESRIIICSTLSSYLPFFFWIGGSETALSCLGGAGLYPLLMLPRSLSTDQSLFFLETWETWAQANIWCITCLPDNFIMQGTARADVVASIGFGFFLPANNQLSLPSLWSCLSHLGT